MKRCVFFTLLLSLSISTHAPTWAGGIVQEMLIAPPGTSNTQNTQTSNTTGPVASTTAPEAPAPQPLERRAKCQPEVRIRLVNRDSTQITWQSQTHHGEKPSKYQVFRRTEDGSWELIGEVDGSTLHFTDHGIEDDGRTYSYRIVAVYENNGNPLHLSTSTQSIYIPRTVEQPEMGLACQSASWSQAPSLWLLLLLLPFLRRRRKLA